MAIGSALMRRKFGKKVDKEWIKSTNRAGVCESGDPRLAETGRNNALENGHRDCDKSIRGSESLVVLRDTVTQQPGSQDRPHGYEVLEFWAKLRQPKN